MRPSNHICEAIRLKNDDNCSLPFCFREFPAELGVVGDIDVGLFMDSDVLSSRFSNFILTVSRVTRVEASALLRIVRDPPKHRGSHQELGSHHKHENNLKY